MSDTKKTAPVNEVILRSYPKVIFFYPLLLVTLVLWIIKLVPGDIGSTLGMIWFVVFFANMFVIAFDFSSTKFFILVLAIIVVVMVLVFSGLLSGVGGGSTMALDLNLTADFYLVMLIILAFILAMVVLGVHFSYYKIERNEIYYKKGLAGSAERFPVKSLRMHKEIPDIFEYLALRAGSITLIPSKDKVIMLPTVLNINKKAAQIDDLLSRIRVEVDDNA